MDTRRCVEGKTGRCVGGKARVCCVGAGGYRESEATGQSMTLTMGPCVASVGQTTRRWEKGRADCAA